MAAYCYQPTTVTDCQRLHDIVGLHMELFPEMPERQDRVQQVGILYLVDAAALCADEETTLAVLYHIHCRTTA